MNALVCKLYLNFFFFKDPGLFLHHWTLADPVTNSDQQNAVDVTL